MTEELDALFDTLRTHATPLTEELVAAMQGRVGTVSPAQEASVKRFWDSPSLRKWSGLVQTPLQSTSDRRRDAFLKEWYSTLQILRDIAARVSLQDNRPSWIEPTAPAGVQADQFLHAHYYQRAFDGRRPMHEELFLRNRPRRDEALNEAIGWWRRLPEAPGSEDNMVNVTALFLQRAMSEEELSSMTYEVFQRVCWEVHAIKDYARRVRNTFVGLPSDRNYSIEEKVGALSRRAWSARTVSGVDVRGVIRHILHGGEEEEVPVRIWQALREDRWKMEGLGISALGELVGWALPDSFPPRNGRTSKALRSLGFDVKVHVN